MSSDQIKTELSDGVFTLQINRPDKKNALTLAMYQALIDGLNEADSDDKVRAILISGTDDCFTSGNDMADFLENPPTGMESPVFKFTTTISEARKPIVAAVNGLAVGVGATMLLHCDLAYAGENAKFLFPFVNLGLCPEAGSSLLLPRIMGHQRAAELILLGEMFKSDKACSLGIVTEVCPDADVRATAMSKALKLASQPAASVRLTKEMLKRSYASALQQTKAEEVGTFVERLKSPEAAEALLAFKERRKPDFSKFN